VISQRISLCRTNAHTAAYFTNPNEASFRSFLTDLSFQLYLRKLRAAPATTASKQVDPHVLTFSNHVSIWLKTPRYKLQSCGFFTIVAMSPESLPGPQVPRSVTSPFSASTTFFFGCFGRWWCLADTAENEALAVQDRVASSVVALETTDERKEGKAWPLDVCRNLTKHKVTAVETPESSDEEEVATPTEEHKSNKKPVKATFRAGSRRASPSVRYHTKTRITTPTADTSTEYAAGASSPLASPDAKAPTDSDEDPLDDAAENQALSNITLLETRLEQLQTASAIKQSRLSGELEALRVQKKDEDHARAQLKSRSRTLEESKRLAEVDHHESERKLAAARHHRQTLEDKVERIKGEIQRLERKEAEARERKLRSVAAREGQEVELGERMAERQARAELAEERTRALGEQVEALERGIEERKAELVARRQLGHVQRLPPNSTARVSAYGLPPGQWPPYREHHVASTALGSYVPPGCYPQPVLSQQPSPDLVSNSPPPSGFYEHRRAHRKDLLGSISPSLSTETLGRTTSHDSIHDPFSTSFAPFGPSLTAADPAADGPRNVSLPFFVGGHLTSLNNEDPVTPGESTLDAPLSPMTPHQASLIPSHLFSMLDEDEDDDQMPESPSIEYKPARLGLAHPEEAENAFRFGPIGSGTRRSDSLRPLSQEQLIEEDNLLSHQLRPPRHPLSLNPDAVAFSLPSSSEAAEGPIKKSLFSWPTRKEKAAVVEK
jgi:hypothetical protein